MARIERLLETFIAEQTMKFDGEKSFLFDLIVELLENENNRLYKFATKLSSNIEKFSMDSEFKLKLKIAELNKLNPLDILRLGYAKIEQNGSSVKDIKAVDENHDLQINFINGVVTATVKEKKNGQRNAI